MEHKINLEPKKISLWLGSLTAFFAVISLIIQYRKFFAADKTAINLEPLFGLETELSLPSIYSVLLLFMAAVLLALVTILKKKEGARYVFNWFILTCGFFLMTLDEGASIHELLMEPMGKLMGSNTPRVFYYTWVIPALILVFIIGLLFIKFVFALPGKTRLEFLIAAVIYLCGAVGFEMVCGIYAVLYGVNNFGINLLANFEEIFEMGGTILFIHALLDYIGKSYLTVKFRI
jgi:hypothetical protein